MDATRGHGDESFGDGLSRSQGRWFPVALVHTDRGSPALRPRHLGLGPCAVVCGCRTEKRVYSFSYSQWTTDRNVCRPDDRARFSSNAGHRNRPSNGLLESLGVAPVFVGQSEYDKFVVVESERIVRSLSPDFRELAAVNCRGVIVTSTCDDREYHFVSRYFAPQAGIDEDPVTGSAHCSLGPYWGERLGKNSLVGYQASARGGVVRVRLAGDRVILGGYAVTVVAGELL